MMQYLLDTHVLLWWLSEPEQLSKKAQAVISDPSNAIYVSSASTWELAIKQSIGRLQVPRNLLQLVSECGMVKLPVSPEETLGVIDLPDIHRDPFDRLLVAQAKYHDMVLITRDSNLHQYPLVTLQA